MATPAEQNTGQNKEIAQVISGGSTAKALTGVGAVVLSIFAFAGFLPTLLVAIAAIAIGAGLLFDGAAIVGEYKKILARMPGDTQAKADLSGGAGAEVFLGIGVIVLAILALFGLVPHVLLPVAAITAGTALAITADVLGRLNRLALDVSDAHSTVRQAVHYFTSSAASTQIVAGVAAIVLGILALVGITPETLTQVAFLVIGAAMFLGGTAVTGRLLAPLYR
jgi:hypothetical protein